MKVFIKRNLIILCSIAMLLCGMLAYLTLNKNAQVNADTVTSVDFEVVDGASIRLAEPTGLRFRLKISDSFKSNLKDTDSVGAFIFPKDYLPASETVDYAKDIATKLDYDLTDALYYDQGYWYANFVIANINEGNYNRDFVAIGYVKNAEAEYEYAEYNATKHARSVAYVADEAYLDYSTPTNGYSDIRKTLSEFMKPIREVNPTFAGYGTQENPYLIYTKAQFDSMGANLSSNNYYENKYFKLMQDLVDNATVVKKAGSQAAPFKGTFDGDGHTVNINLTNSTTSETHIGLFAFNYGTIKNLTVTGSVTCSNSTVGGIAGENAGVIYNCVNKATISGKNNVGGITGRNKDYTASTIEVPVIENCTNEASVTGTDYVAGVTGVNNSKVINSYNGSDVVIAGTGSHIGDIVYNATGGTLENEEIPGEEPDDGETVDFNAVLDYFVAQGFIKGTTSFDKKYFNDNAQEGKLPNQEETRNMLTRAFRKITNTTGAASTMPTQLDKSDFTFGDTPEEDATARTYWYARLNQKQETDGGMLRTLMIRIYNYLNK